MGSHDNHLTDTQETELLRDIESALAVWQVKGGDPLPLAPDFAEIISRVRSAFTVAEVAEIVGVKARQVHHWAVGQHNPQGASRDRLLILFQIVSTLETQIDSEQIKVWMWSSNPEIGSRPIDAIKGGRASAVQTVAQNLSLRDEATDESLVALAKRGNTSAYEKLIRRYRSSIERRIRSYAQIGAPSEDLMQEGMLGLYKAIRDYPAGSKLHFAEIADRFIARQIISAAKNFGGEPSPWIPFNLKASDGELDDENDLRRAVDSEVELGEIERLIARLKPRHLPELQSLILSRYLDGLSHEQIARDLQCTTDEIDTALLDAKRAVGAALASSTEFKVANPADEGR